MKSKGKKTKYEMENLQEVIKVIRYNINLKTETDFPIASNGKFASKIASKIEIWNFQMNAIYNSTIKLNT